MIRPAPDSAGERVRHAILAHLHRFGPSAVSELPGRWPVTRHHVRLAVRQLTRDGFVRLVREAPHGPARVTMTEAGRARVSDPS